MRGTGNGKIAALFVLVCLGMICRPAVAENVYLVKDISWPFAGSGSDPHGMIDANGVCYFYANQNASQLWKSNGTSAGTTKVFDGILGAHLLAYSNGLVFFQHQDGTHGVELWKTNGTVAGTALVKDLFPAYPTSDSNPQWLTPYKGALFFAAVDASGSGYHLWRSDGTASGTVIVKRFPSRWAGIWSPVDERMTVAGNTLFFPADDGVHGFELWKSDGTGSGTVMVRDIAPYGGSEPHHLTDVNGTLFFVSSAVGAASGLWKSDGTSQGTVLVRGIGTPTELTNVNGTLFFAAEGGTTGHDLWKSDGTASGTVMVKSMEITPDVSYFTSMNGLLFFTTSYGHLWKSNGTAAGTVRVRTTSPVPLSCYYLTAVNGALFFSASSSPYGRELWKSDGTDAGTVMVKDIDPGSGSSGPEQVTRIGNRLFFSARDSVHGRELWVVDGIPNPTAATARNWDEY